MNTTPSGQKIPISIESEMRSSYLDYAMSVIVGRALPDVRDGLKPVHRRVLFAMHEQRNTWNQSYKKSARIVGDVIGKYHPHGDAAVYDTMVRMAQDFAMRYVLVDGQGNFGSVDGDPAAAMRYTEVRMSRLTSELLADLEKDTVDFAPNYDGSTEEPVVLPARFPNLLVNGSSGIAVGMSTNIPPHNLGEVIDATVALIRDPALTIDELMQHIKGPDFPTAGYIYGRKGFVDAYHKGRGIVQVRARVEVEPGSDGKERIIITELPYQVNKAKLLERIAELVRDKRIEGIAHLQDESDRTGMRVSIELKRDALAQVVINHLFKMTPMQTSFGIIALAIVHGRPQICNLKELLVAFIDHRRDVVTRRCLFELRQARARAHILEGYEIALSNIDEVVELIKTSANPAEARERLMTRFGLSELQAQAILDLRLQRLTGMERDKILEELAQVRAEIERLERILADEGLLMELIVEELRDVRERFADPRRTQIIEDTSEISLEDLIAPDEVVVFVTHAGYIKRMSLSSYRAQHRGGKGKRGTVPKEEDVIIEVFVANTHTDLLVFSDKGRVFRVKVYELPEGSSQARGKPIVNLIAVEKDESVRALLPVKQWREEDCLVFATRQGVVKKTELSAYNNVTSRGLIAINLEEDDDLVAVRLVEPEQHILLASKKGQSIRFDEAELRAMGRATRGVRGISLGRGDSVIGMQVLTGDATVLTVSAAGYGKRTAADEYRIQSRGGKGIITLKTGGRNGDVVAILRVTDTDDLIIATNRGQLIRTPVEELRVLGRNTMGVRLIHLAEGEEVVAVERVPYDEQASAAAQAGEEDDLADGPEPHNAGAHDTGADDTGTDASDDVDAPEGDGEDA